MHRVTALPLLLVLFLGAPAAFAGPQVPDVPLAELPVAGTCAPLPQGNATWITLGEVDWYRIDRDPRDLRGEQVAEVLKGRSKQAAETGTPHDVWIIVGRSRTWGQVVQVLALCQQTGLFRVGLQVQSESGEGVLGFPLFLPAAGEAPSTSAYGTARLLNVRVERPRTSPIPNAPPPKASNPDQVYAAAVKAVEQFGPIVAEASIRRGVSVQEAVRVIDLLYRAGCAAVKFPYFVMRREHTDPVLQIWIDYGGQDRLLEPDPATLSIPPIRARKSAWPDSGAAQPGAFALPVEPIPVGGRSATAQRITPLPNYARTGEEMPPAALKASGERVGDWARRLGGAFAAVMRTQNPAFPEPLLVRSRRQGLGADQFFSEVRRTFPDAAEVKVSTVHLQAYLFRENGIVGRVELTIDTSGPALGLVFARWMPGPYPTEAVRLPPVLTDPYAGGVPGHLRVWVEGVLAAGRARGAPALPLASEASVLAQLPTVAHPSVRGALAQRPAGMDNLVGWLRATPYDRLFVEMADGSAAVHTVSGVRGILRFGLTPEEGELALSSLKVRAAPR